MFTIAAGIVLAYVAIKWAPAIMNWCADLMASRTMEDLAPILAVGFIVGIAIAIAHK